MHATLKIKVVYDTAWVKDERTARILISEMLQRVANHAADEGMLSGDSELVVDDFDYDIDVE